MASQRQTSKLVNSLPGFTKKQVLWGLIGLAVVIGAVWGTVGMLKTKFAIQQQQQKFDTLAPVMQSFKTNAKNLLGSSLTDIKDNNFCYIGEQSEISIPFFQNGVNLCKMQVEGATNEISSLSSATSAYDTMQQIDVLAMNALKNANIPFTHWGNAGQPGRDDSLSYDDMLLLSRPVLRCDVQGTNSYSQAVYHGIVSVSPNQIYFTFNCFQQSSKNFFPTSSYGLH